MQKLIRERKQDGATMVEMAIIIPLLVLLIFAIIEFSLVMYNQAMITFAAREGARAGVVWAPTIDGTSYRVSREQIIEHTEKWLGNKLVSFNNSEPVITPDNPNDVCIGTGINQKIRVNVSYDYSFLILPLWTITLRSEADMRCESIQDAEEE